MARLIDADELKKSLKPSESAMLQEVYNKTWGLIWQEECDIIDDIPNVDIEYVKHGHWKWDDDAYCCSECFYPMFGNTLECMDGTFGFCPHCGAIMDETEK